MSAKLSAMLLPNAAPPIALLALPNAPSSTKCPTNSPPRVGLSLGLGVLPDFLLGFVTSVNCGDDFELFKTQRLKVEVREHGLNIRMQITLSTPDALKLSDKTKTMVSNRPQT